MVNRIHAGNHTTIFAIENCLIRFGRSSQCILRSFVIHSIVALIRSAADSKHVK